MITEKSAEVERPIASDLPTVLVIGSMKAGTTWVHD